jgi:hypothetical protein
VLSGPGLRRERSGPAGVIAASLLPSYSMFSKFAVRYQSPFHLAPETVIFLYTTMN